jgi:ABC-type uncharacterized transport system ATPase subunit
VAISQCVNNVEMGYARVFLRVEVGEDGFGVLVLLDVLHGLARPDACGVCMRMCVCVCVCVCVRVCVSV